MTAVLAYLGAALGVTYALYVFYGCVMNIKRVRDMGEGFEKELGSKLRCREVHRLSSTFRIPLRPA